MKKKGKKNIVYSTNPDFEYESEEDMPNSGNREQHLLIFPDKKNRKGKIVTVIRGFHGNAEEIKSLERGLKSHCGTGGTSKNGDILLQGNFIQKAGEFLKKLGYHFKVSGI